MESSHLPLYKVTDWRVSRIAFPPAYLFQLAQTGNRMRKRLNRKGAGAILITGQQSCAGAVWIFDYLMSFLQHSDVCKAAAILSN